MLRYVDADERFVAMLGPCVRVVVEPYVDGRRRKVAADADQLELDLVATEASEGARNVRKQAVRVARGTQFVTKRSGRLGASLR